MDLSSIINYLYEKRTIHNKEFAESLIPGSTKMIGVKVPILRNVAKEIAKADPTAFLKINDFSYYELEMLHAMVLGYMKLDINETLNYVTAFLPHIHDWSVTDTFCSTFKIAKKHQQIVWDYLMSLIKSNSEFTLRVVVVMLMCYYLNDQYIDQVVEICKKLKHEGYYYKMGLAWLVATMMAKYQEKCLDLLNSNSLDSWTHNKTIQKMIESYRVDNDVKLILRKMKRS